METNNNNSASVENAAEAAVGAVSGSGGTYAPDGGAAPELPKKSSKRFLIIAAVIVVILAALSPFAFAFAKKMHLRNNPDLYILSAIDETRFFKSTAAEITAGVSPDTSLGEDMELLLKALSSAKLLVKISDFNSEPKGDEGIWGVRYDLLYKDELVIDVDAAFGKSQSKVNVAGGSMVVKDMGFDNFANGLDVSKNEKAFRELLKDGEIQDIFRDLLSSATLNGKDIVDEKTGKKSDVVGLKITLKNIYEATKKMVDILDTNAALRNYIKGGMNSYLDSLENSGISDEMMMGGMDIEEIRDYINSESYIPEIQDAFKTLDQQLKFAFSVINPEFSAEMYISDGQVVRTNFRASLTISAVLGSVQPTTFFVNIDSYESDYKSGSVEADQDSLIVERGNDSEELAEAGRILGESIAVELSSRPGFQKLIEDLGSKVPQFLFDSFNN